MVLLPQQEHTMRNPLKISLWALVLATASIGAVLSFTMRASSREPGSDGSPIIGAMHAVTASADLGPARSSATAVNAGSLRFFGFLGFDRAHDAPGDLTGFGPLPAE